MSFVGSMLGAGQGSGWTAQGAPITTVATPDQANAAYAQSQGALAQQQNFVNALAAQNGIQNQSQVYNQLQNMANGLGPNPAQTILAQQTGINNANQAALMAGQRGAGANVGLMARQAAQQGAANQQSAIGQAASLQAQQSANAINSMGQLATQQVGQQGSALGGYSGAVQAEQGNILGAIAAQNNAQVGMMSNQNNANSNIQIQNSKAQQGIFGGLLGGSGSMLAHGGMVQAKADGGSISPNPTVSIVPNSQPNFNNSSSAGPQSFVGKFLTGASSNIGNEGAPTPGNSGGGGGGGIFQGVQTITGKGLNSIFGKAPAASPTAMTDSLSNQIGLQAMSNENLMANPDIQALTTTDLSGEAGATDLGSSSAASSAAADASADSSLGDFAALVAHGGQVTKPMDRSKKAKNLKGGGKVPGKAKHSGDTLKNDTVPAMLSPQEIVIPRSIATHPDAPSLAAKFVAATLAKHNLKRA